MRMIVLGLLALLGSQIAAAAGPPDIVARLLEEMKAYRDGRLR
jgi:hypothetical protein